MAKKPTKPTSSGSKGQGIVIRTPTPTQLDPSAGQVYIGVDTGSDLEKYGYQYYSTRPADPYARSGPASFSGVTQGRRLPKYKVGYQNSKRFSRELNNMDPNVIYLYQQRMEAMGLLDKYVPGKLDKATRGAFKELLTTANQTGASWQETLQEIETTGGLVDAGADGSSGTARQPFVAQLDDPTTLREAFQQTAQQLYGGDLPDDEVNAMVDAYRSIQMQKQKAAYDMDETGGVIESEANPSAFAAEQIKAKHPDQVNRVKFSETLGTILSTLGSSPAGGQ